MPFKIVRNDITKMEVDAIVNAANTSLAPGSGVCGAVFAAAGYDELDAACREIGHCDTGSAVITKGYNLRAKYIIHTPGPVYMGGHQNEEKLLYSCYKSSMELAKENGVESIAFPVISSGIYGYPKAAALRIATNAVMDFLQDNDMTVYLVVYGRQLFEISSKLFADVKEYISENLIIREDRNERLKHAATMADILTAREKAQAKKPYIAEYSASMPAMPHTAPNIPPGGGTEADINNLFRNMDASFSEYLLTLIDKSGMTDAQVYKKANVDRKLFSKIRSNPQYRPSKTTAVAFAIALGLDMNGTRDLIGRAGYALTHSSKFDIIIEYFLTRKNYNIFEINEVLFAFDQPLIGV